MKSKALTLAFAALAATAVAAKPAQAQEAITITAEVVDLVCYLNMGVKGESHRECAQVCADAGLALGFLGSDGQIYLASGQGMPAAATNPQLRPHAEHTVEVTGMLHERSGARSIVIESISMKK
ncbi:MAG: hypothetical protein OEU54_02390 [Gemmatimonadota bacterium]|nr:hypothetical protein [Gemmatimonadota bacterium]